MFDFLIKRGKELTLLLTFRRKGLHAFGRQPLSELLVLQREIDRYVSLPNRRYVVVFPESTLEIQLLAGHLIRPDSDCVGEATDIPEDAEPHTCDKIRERSVGFAGLEVDPPCRLLAADKLENLLFARTGTL